MDTIRMVVSDLDGTLLSEDHRLTDEVVDAIRQFTSQGGKFTFATGRPLLTVRSVVERLDPDLPFILCNGAVIADRNRIWEKSLLSLSGLEGLLREADSRGLTVLLFYDHEVRIMRRTPDAEAFEIKEETRCVLAERNRDRWLEENVQKIILMGDIETSKSLWHKHAEGFREQYSVFQSEHNFWEIMPANQSKGAALRRLMNFMNLRPQEVLAIGNQMNDLDMLQTAGIGAAVANSHPLLKEEADYVCTRSYGEGVIEVLEKFCLRNADSVAGKKTS